MSSPPLLSRESESERVRATSQPTTAYFMEETLNENCCTHADLDVNALDSFLSQKPVINILPCRSFKNDKRRQYSIRNNLNVHHY